MQPTTQPPIAEILAQHVYASGAVGITRGQTARWHVVNPRLPIPTTAPVCSVTLSFTNAQGEVLKSDSVSVKPGESRSLDLNADSDLPPGGTRSAIHAQAVVPVTGPVDELTGRGTCPLLATLEVVDNRSGQTSILMEGTLVRPVAPIAREGRGKP